MSNTDYITWIFPNSKFENTYFMNSINKIRINEIPFCKTKVNFKFKYCRKGKNSPKGTNIFLSKTSKVFFSIKYNEL